MTTLELLQKSIDYIEDNLTGEFGCSPSKFLKLNIATEPKAVNLLDEAKIMLTNTQIKDLLSNWAMPETKKILYQKLKNKLSTKIGYFEADIEIHEHH